MESQIENKSSKKPRFSLRQKVIAGSIGMAATAGAIAFGVSRSVPKKSSKNKQVPQYDPETDVGI